MVEIAVIVGVIWVVSLTLVLAICRASGRADRAEEAGLTPVATPLPSAPPVPSTLSVPSAPPVPSAPLAASAQPAPRRPRRFVRRAGRASVEAEPEVTPAAPRLAQR